MTSKTITSPYVYTPRNWMLRDATAISYTKGESKALTLERHLNDLYRHFLYTMTNYMENTTTDQSQRLQALLGEIVATKKLLEKEN